VVADIIRIDREVKSFMRESFTPVH